MALLIHHTATARSGGRTVEAVRGNFRAGPGDFRTYACRDASCDIAAENRKAAQVHFYDLDMALDMINFVRETILAQPGVAQLSQNSSIPAMALQLMAVNGAK